MNEKFIYVCGKENRDKLINAGFALVGGSKEGLYTFINSEKLKVPEDIPCAFGNMMQYPAIYKTGW